MGVLGKLEISPTDWGAVCDYDTRRYSQTQKRCVPWEPHNYRPQQRLVHWGGSNPYNVLTPEDAKRVTRGIDRYHVYSRKWSAIAYNRSFGGGVMCRARGEHRNGAHKNSSKWGYITDACIMLIAHPTETPLLADRHNFAIHQLSNPLPVLGHGQLPDQSTQCPGPWLLDWIGRKGWVEDFGTWSVGDFGYATRAIRERLKQLGYKGGLPKRRRYTKSVARQVRKYQRAEGLLVDGWVGGQTYRALTNLPT